MFAQGHQFFPAVFSYQIWALLGPGLVLNCGLNIQHPSSRSALLRTLRHFFATSFKVIGPFADASDEGALHIRGRCSEHRHHNGLIPLTIHWPISQLLPSTVKFKGRPGFKLLHLTPSHFTYELPPPGMTPKIACLTCR